jgi:hypothetical protein
MMKNLAPEPNAAARAAVEDGGDRDTALVDLDLDRQVLEFGHDPGLLFVDSPVMNSGQRHPRKEFRRTASISPATRLAGSAVPAGAAPDPARYRAA